MGLFPPVFITTVNQRGWWISEISILSILEHELLLKIDLYTGHRTFELDLECTYPILRLPLGLTPSAPCPLTEFSGISFGDTLGQVKPWLEPVGFFWKNTPVRGRAGTNFWTGRTCWYKLYKLFGRGGTNLGRDGLRWVVLW